MGKVIVLLIICIAAFFYVLNNGQEQQAKKTEKTETQILSHERKVMEDVRKLEDQMQEDVDRRMAPVN